MKFQNKYIFYIILGSIGIISFYFMITLGFWFIYKNKVYPNIFIAGINISGKTQEEAEKILTERIDLYNSKKVKIVSQKPEDIYLKDIGISFDINKSISNAISKSSKNPFMLGFKKDFPLTLKYSNDLIYNLINNQNEILRTTTKSPEIFFEGDELKVKSGDAGVRVNFSETVHNFKQSASELETDYNIAIFNTGEAVLGGIDNNQKKEILEKTKNNLVINTKNNSYIINDKEKLSFVDLSGEGISKAMIYEGDKFLFPGENLEGSIFSERKISLYLSDLAGEINFNPINAKLGTLDGKVTISSKDIDGQKVNIEKSSEIISSAINSNEKETNLTLEPLKAEIRVDNLEELGLSELVSTGYSNFAGSPVNRRHNIKVGASKFNGVLIRPGETFSFITTLGPVDASTGYLPELVIKDNKTIPEYGGGMCQVSSTAFRAALNAGLPIVSRRAHSYPVSYYKPYGVDATVYIPKPDLIFKNDTEKYILIQTRIDGNKLSFDFYGTKLKRTLSFSGNEGGAGAVPIVEKVSPLIYDIGVRGNGSFTAVIWRFIYDESGKLKTTSKFVSKYDSPDKYPH